jgi:hypothetical protein
VSEFLQDWYASMKRARISLRARNVAMTTAAVAVLLYAWEWLVYGWLLAPFTPSAPIVEALVDLLVAFLFAVLYEMRERRAGLLRGALFGLLSGLLAHVPANLLAFPGDPRLAERALPGVVGLMAAGLLAALIHRRDD